ncbi:cysteine protease ATG4D [Chanos chanos]|uniref:Cysteine protease n=1 Tax=Chanos chanos TaxID=29144 RepID=A0A6J2WR87_CHACN|nr:cysteine protease ATG4D-like [Chanos chanos]
MDLNASCDDGTEYSEEAASFEFVSVPAQVPPDPCNCRDHAAERVDRTNVKSKLMSAWNNVRYGGWSIKSKPRLSKTSPVFLLGRAYLLSPAGERESFRRAFSSLFWLTYRRSFPKLEGSSLTSDCGWGCMLRSGQMLLAQGLMRHLLPTDWTWPATHRHQTTDDLTIHDLSNGSQFHHANGTSSRDAIRPNRKSLGSVVDSESENEKTHRRVVSWFGDTPDTPFGLHQLVKLGEASGKRAGDWYGPSIVAHILRKAVAASELQSLTVYVAQDCTVYKEDVLRLCQAGASEARLGLSGWKSVIILVPVRLGGDNLNPAYIECVKKLLSLRCCIGIIGGKPKHSLFFVGFQDERLIYLDPHYCQSTVDVSVDNFPLESFHCKFARKMPFSRMDPSCTIGFYAKNRRDFDTLCTEVSVALTSSTEKYPIFTFADGCGQDERDEEDQVTPDRTTHLSSPTVTQRHGRASKRSSLDEFVLL